MKKEIITKRYLMDKTDMQEVIPTLQKTWVETDIIFGVDENIDLFTDLIIVQFDSALLENKSIVYLLQLLDFWRQH